MSTPNKIESFSGHHRFLSNFYACEILLDGEMYPSVEHAYQAAKTLDVDQRETIRRTAAASYAKRLGRRVTLRKDWEHVKLTIMLGLLRQKFQDERLRRLLLRTAPLTLIEGNNWNDTYWGVCDGKGDNHLGRLLMQVREEIARGLEDAERRELARTP